MARSVLQSLVVAVFIGFGCASALRATPQTESASGQNATAGSTITLTGRATDPEGRLRWMAFYIAGPVNSGYAGWNHVATVDLSGSDATATYQWPSPGTPGDYAVHIRAFNDAWEADSNGNVVAGFTLASPNTSPTTNWVAGSNIILGGAVTLTGNASDPDGNLTWLHFYVTGPGLSGWHHKGSASISGYSATESISWTPTETGTYQVHIRAEDSLGAWDANANIVGEFTVGADPAPTIAVGANNSGILYLGSGAQPMRADWLGQDANGNMNQYLAEIFGPNGSYEQQWVGIGGRPGFGSAWDNSGAQRSGAQDGWWHWEAVPSAGYGHYKMRVHYLDVVGGQAGQEVHWDVVNRAPTTVSVAASSPGAGQPTALTATVSDPDGNLKWVHFYIDGPAGSGIVAWTHVGSVQVSGSSATTAPLNWMPPNFGGDYRVHIRCEDETGTYDWNGNQVATFHVRHAQPIASAYIVGSTATIYAGETITLNWQGSNSSNTLSYLMFRVGSTGATLVSSSGLTGTDSGSWGVGGWVSGGGPFNFVTTYRMDVPGTFATWAHARTPDWDNVTVNGNGDATINGPQITVLPANQAPVTQSIGAPNATVGNPVTITARATDGNGNLHHIDLFYAGPGAPAWQFIATKIVSGADATVTHVWTPPNGLSGDYTLHLRAYDTAGVPDSNGNITSSFHIYGNNIDPVTSYPSTNGSSNSAAPATIGSGQTMWAEILGTDGNENMDLYLCQVIKKGPNGDDVYYEQWVGIGAANRVLQYSFLPTGISSSWTDNPGSSRTPGRSGTWRWNVVLPSSFSGDYELRVHHGDTNQRYHGRGSFFRLGSVSLPAVVAVNASPATNVPAAGPVTFTGSATDADGDLTQLVFEVSGPSYPAWTAAGSASVNPQAASAARSVIWTPSGTLATGTYTVRMRAFDAGGQGSSSYATTTFVVPPPPGPPVPGSIAVSPTPKVSPRGPITFTTSATDADADLARIAVEVSGPGYATWTEVMFAAVSPAAASAIKTISWTPAAPLSVGTYSVRVRATDAANQSNTAFPASATFVVATAGSSTDWDGDGLPNDWEIAAGLNPNDPNDVSSANYQAYVYDKASRLKTGPGRTYTPDAEGNTK